MQAAVFSAVSFSLGAALPLLVATQVPLTNLVWIVAVSSLIFLVILGAVAAKAGGAGMLRGAVRVLFWGTLAMAATWGVGRLFGVMV